MDRDSLDRERPSKWGSLGLIVAILVASFWSRRDSTVQASKDRAAPRDVGTAGPDRDLMLQEAQWVYDEMADFVKLIQRYRSLYVTALAASIGWLLGHALEPNYLQQVRTLQSRPEISAALCLIPMLSCFFVALIFEAQFHMRSLARYRYLLGIELGGGTPAWGWEDWKKTAAGSIRSWNIPSNIFFGIAALAVPIGALVLAWPAAADARGWLLWLWLGSAFTFALFVVLAVWVGIENFYTNKDVDLDRKLPDILAAVRRRI